MNNVNAIKSMVFYAKQFESARVKFLNGDVPSANVKQWLENCDEALTFAKMAIDKGREAGLDVETILVGEIYFIEDIKPLFLEIKEGQEASA